MPSRFSAALLAAAAAAFAAGALAQAAYPDRPIKIIAPVQPGGGVDLVAHQVGDRLSRVLGQPVVIENQSGGGGVVGSLATARAAPNGYTLMVGYVGTHGTNPAVRKLPYDASKDFTAIAMVGGTPNVLVVPPSLPVKTLPEFIAYAKKANPPLAFASGGVGSQHFFAMAQLKQRGGFNVLDVTYRGGSPAMQATITGETQVLFAGGESAGQFKAGTLRALAMSGKERSKAMPDVPTIGETYPGYAVDIWLGLFAPAGTPQPIIDKLRTIVQAELKKPEVAAKVNVSGSLMPLILSPDEFAARIKNDDEKFGKLAKELNVHIQ